MGRIMEDIIKIDPVVELARIDSELRAMLEAHPELAAGHEEDVEELNQVLYLPRHPTAEEWAQALKMGSGA
jgi:hypothetical protein